MTVLFCDRSALIEHQRGVIRATLRATSTRGSIIKSGEIAFTPFAAMLFAANLLRAVEDFQKDQECKVVQFRPRDALAEGDEA